MDVQTAVLAPEALEDLVAALRRRCRAVIGPVVRDGAIVLAEIESADELPAGVGDDQEGGSYRLRRRDDAARFGWAVGPQSAKRELLPPSVAVWRKRRDADGGVAVEPAPPPDGPVALLGLRPCDLAAISIQDRVFLGGATVEPDYAARRRDAWLVVVDCGEPAATCFCTSLGSGPRAGEGYDLALTEVLDGGHRLVARAGSERGAELLAELPRREAAPEDLDAARRVTDGAVARMPRHLDTGGLPELLERTLDSPHWDDVASRCLSCGNCTLVCPTCFCTSVEDTTDLAGETAERRRVWASCYSLDHSYLHGGSVRTSGRSRYRQWLTHKLGTWHDQFGTSGCVGCGRCITWCPVAIDLTQEVASLRAEEVSP